MFTSKVESDKGQLEIVYDVQWKTPGNDDDKAKIIGIVDTPDTYLDWNTFKSYLIQNSGNMRFTTDDIRISYLDSDDDLIPVDNASEFRECLKFSRTRARRGRKIMMKVSLVSNGGAKPKNYSKHSGESSKNPKLFCLKKKDISTSIKKNGGVSTTEKQEKPQKNEIDTNAVPIWFEAYMTKFKAEIIDEITTAVVSNVRSECGSNTAVKSRNTEPPQKEPHQYYPLQHMFEKRKKKKKMPEEDSSDCTDGLQLQWEERLELLRHMQKINKREKKFEKKLDAKLEKLESKTKKIMEKKHNLWGVKKSTGIPLPSHNLQTAEPVTTTTATATATTSNSDNLTANQCMDAVPVDEYNFVPHVLRGETVHQVWKVVNNGQKQWTEDTELRFAWGSKSLVPLTTVVKCPLLKPGETGKIKVTLQAPLFPGHFESYWHFHHQGRRFGHWLGCAVIVDAEPRPTTPQQQQQQPQQQTIKVEPKTAAEIYQMQSQVQPETELETDAAPSSPVDLTMKTYIDILSFEGGDAFCQELDVKPETQPQMIIEEPPQIEKLESAGLHLQAFLAAEPKQTPQYGLVISNDSMNVLDYVNCMYFPEEEDKHQNIALDLKKRDSMERNNLDTDSYEKVLTQVENISIEENQKNEEKLTTNTTENNVNVNDPEYNSGSDSDNISILSDTISVDTDDSEPSEEFVVVPMPTCLNCEQEVQDTNPEVEELEQPQAAQPQETPESDNNNNMEDLKPFPKMPQLSLPPMPELCNEAEAEAENLDSDPNTVFIRDETGMAIPVAKVVQPQIPVQHSTFGDPNFGQGPTGPRFPFNEVPHSPPVVSHNPVGSCNFRPQLPFEPNQSVPIYSSHQQRTCHESAPFNSFDEMYQAQEIAGAAAGLRGNAGAAAWTNAYHNIHTEQPRACKFTYAYSNSSKENLSNSGCSNRSSSGSRRTSSDTREQSPVAAAVQILPETLVTGAVNVASSAINTARSVIDMLRPRHDEPLVAQWDPITPAMEAALRQLSEMGFNNRELNIMLLKQHKNDVARVISELVQ